MSRQEERNRQVVRTMVEALERQDFAALETHPGLHETRKYHPLWHRGFPDLTYTVNEMLADGDMVATRLTMRGTHGGPFMGVDPTQQEINLGVLLMDQVVDGQIVKHWANADWVTVLIQLGVIPPIKTL